jgi:hypothetical protein
VKRLKHKDHRTGFTVASHCEFMEARNTASCLVSVSCCQAKPST